MGQLGTIYTGMGGTYPGSDIRLKENIRPAGIENGIRLYTWDWNSTAKRLGFDVYPTKGVIAQEVAKSHPDSVLTDNNGYLRVDYSKLI